MSSYERDYSEHGYFILKGFCSVDWLTRLEAHINCIYDQWRDELGEEINDLVNMHSLTNACYFRQCAGSREDFFQLIAHKELWGLLQEVFSGNLYFHNTQLFFNPLNSAKKPYWHRDLQFSSYTNEQQEKELAQMLSLHVRIALEDEEGLLLIPGTHKRWDTSEEHAVRFQLDGRESDEFLDKQQVIALERGDIIVFNAQMIHRGHYSAQASRKAFDICCGTPHDFTCSFLDEAVLPDREEVHALCFVHAWQLLDKSKPLNS